MNQCKKPNQQLLVPITIWIGMEQAFIGADFTQVQYTRENTPENGSKLMHTICISTGIRLMCFGYSQYWLCNDLFWCC